MSAVAGQDGTGRVDEDRREHDRICEGDVSADDAWIVISAMLADPDRQDAQCILWILRTVVWKLLDRRRRDDELLEWADILNRSDALLADDHPDVAAGIRILMELDHGCRSRDG